MGSKEVLQVQRCEAARKNNFQRCTRGRCLSNDRQSFREFHCSASPFVMRDSLSVTTPDHFLELLLTVTPVKHSRRPRGRRGFESTADPAGKNQGGHRVL